MVVILTTVLTKCRLMKLETTRTTRAVRGAATAIFALLVMGAVARIDPQPVRPTEVADATAVPEPSPTRLPIDGETWILESIDGQPLIDGTYATLTIDGPRFGGFDGCNSFGDRHESGTPVVKPDGTISVQLFVRTAADCPTDAIFDQSNRYLRRHDAAGQGPQRR